MAKPKGLGRGLDALLGDDSAPPRADDGLRSLGIEISHNGED